MISKNTCYTVVFICIILIIGIKEYYTDNLKKIEDFESLSKEDIDNEVKNIIKSKKTSLNNKLISSCKDGLIRGCIVGCLAGGIPAAIISGTTFGLTNAVVTFIRN